MKIRWSFGWETHPHYSNVNQIFFVFRLVNLRRLKLPREMSQVIFYLNLNKQQSICLQSNLAAFSFQNSHENSIRKEKKSAHVKAFNFAICVVNTQINFDVFQKIFHTDNAKLNLRDTTSSDNDGKQHRKLIDFYFNTKFLSSH